MKLLLLLASFALGLLPASARAEEPAPAPYLGNWSNGRGETLVIKTKTLRFAADKPVPYRDITKAGDGHVFTLEITAKGAVNYFSKFLLLDIGSADAMIIQGFNAFADVGLADKISSEQRWDRD